MSMILGLGKLPNPNTNCLEGMRCPACNSFGPFQIDATVTVTVTDDGTADDGHDYDWVDDARCVCSECEHEGAVVTFTESPRRQTVILLGSRELATVLAALRMFQQKCHEYGGDIVAADWPNHFTDNRGERIEPLGDADIDTLCERINR